jgi:hypothetical protein
LPQNNLESLLDLVARAASKPGKLLEIVGILGKKAEREEKHNLLTMMLILFKSTSQLHNQSSTEIQGFFDKTVLRDQQN